MIAATVQRFQKLGLDLAARLSFVPPTLARVVVGWAFVVTGWGKLHNLESVTKFFGELGIPFPAVNALVASSTELVGGALLLVGLFTRLAALPLSFTMLVAIATARRDDLTSAASLFGFVETLYIVVFLWLAAAGAGPVSLDRALFGRKATASPAAPPLATRAAA